MSREKRDKEFEKKIEEEEIKKKELIQERIKTERDILIKRKQEIEESPLMIEINKTNNR